ncbi:torsin-3A [Elephas maximus indicus]|uniref:torsin-3A n=1 Tax=Elephas maximus indicus TaxID=99487 RepID=UPI002116A50B|nr:torsin-3A [Elephas maximus indicus]
MGHQSFPVSNNMVTDSKHSQDLTSPPLQPTTLTPQNRLIPGAGPVRGWGLEAASGCPPRHEPGFRFQRALGLALGHCEASWQAGDAARDQSERRSACGSHDNADPGPIRPRTRAPARPGFKSREEPAAEGPRAGGPDGCAARALAMARGPRRPLGLCLLLLLLLLLPGAPGREGAARPGESAAETGAAWPGLQGLKERLKAAGAVSRRYWTLFICQMRSKDCEEDEEATTEPLAWNLPLLTQRYLDILTMWYCSFQGCCDSGDCRISNNFTGLESDLSVRLHGQHLAQELVLRAVRSYIETPQPGKALALSFHGWSGTGKNFVARMLAENLYRDGLRSDCVQVFITMFHFPHPKYVDLYKEQLSSQIQETQQRCHQTLFIFDEAEKLHPGLLEALEPHLERRAPKGHRAKAPRTIFLFLSNLGGNIINEVVLNLLKAGWSREEITMEHLEPHLQAEIVESTDSGFGHSRLLKENLIDFFVPFLPLEYRHVRLCARDAFLSQELLYTEEALDEIAKMMTYVPKEEQLFSSQGCKSISQRINYFLP